MLIHLSLTLNQRWNNVSILCTCCVSSLAYWPLKFEQLYFTTFWSVSLSVCFICLKAQYPSEIDFFIIQERFNKLTYLYNHKMWHLTACKISVILSFLKWSDFYCISELMLQILIHRYNKKIISFQEWETNWNFADCQMPIFYDHINTIYQFIISFFDKNVYFWGIWSL